MSHGSEPSEIASPISRLSLSDSNPTASSPVASSSPEDDTPRPKSTALSNSSSRSSSLSHASAPPTRPPPPPPSTSATAPSPPEIRAVPTVSGVTALKEVSLDALRAKLAPADQPWALSPLRAHYLKKQLIGMQFAAELDLLARPDALSFFGPPFKPAKSGDGRRAEPLDLPFLRFIFHQFVLTFPFLTAAPQNFWADKVQVFLHNFLERNLATTGDEEEEGKRQAMRAKVEKHLALMLGAGVKVDGGEEVVQVEQSDLRRMDEERARASERARLRNGTAIDINIVTVRSVVTKGKVRHRAHEEFIIRTRTTHGDGPPEDVYVSRRYGDFKRLADELRREFPEEEVRPPPSKDKSSSTSQAAEPDSPAPSINSTDDTPTTSPTTTSGWSSWYYSTSISAPPPAPPEPTSSLAREKNRLTLRAYLRAFLSSRAISNSSTLRGFLLADPTALSREEAEDVRRREEMDRVREEGRARFQREMERRAEEVMSSVRKFKENLVQRDGLSQIFSTIKENPDVRGLPEQYRKVLEWARISLASTIYQLYVASDNASETFASLKRLHGLMPYFMLRGILKISNPIAMVRGVLDLFLAQPFGQRSLLQRMFSASLYEDVRELEEDIAAVRAKVEDEVLCEKIRQFVYAPAEIQAIYRADADAENLNLLSIILRSGEQPALNREQFQRVARSSRAFVRYEHYRARLVDSDDDEGPEDEDAWLYEDLSVLMRLYVRLRDKQQMIEMIFEGVTADLLKDIVTIFYSPLAQVYKAANIADSISDFQAFLNDLIKTVEDSEERAQVDPAGTVQIFIDLVERHEVAFYNFVYKVHTKGEDLFDALMHWIERFLNFFRDGLSQRVNLDFILPHTGREREAILKEVDDVAIYHYKLKVAHEERTRRRFLRGGGEGDGADEESAAWVEGVVQGLGVDATVTGDVDDIAAEESDDEGDDEYDLYDESEDSASIASGRGARHHPHPRTRRPSRGAGAAASGSSPRGSTESARPRFSALKQRLKHGAGASASNSTSPGASVPPSPTLSSTTPHDTPPMRPRKPKRVPIDPPALKELPALLPVFVELLRPQLEYAPPRRTSTS